MSFWNITRKRNWSTWSPKLQKRLKLRDTIMLRARAELSPMQTLQWRPHRPGFERADLKNIFSAREIVTYFRNFAIPWERNRSDSMGLLHNRELRRVSRQGKGRESETCCFPMVTHNIWRSVKPAERHAVYCHLLVTWLLPCLSIYTLFLCANFDCEGANRG